MRNKKYMLPVLLTGFLFSCGETPRDWKNDFIGSWKGTSPDGIFLEEWSKEQNGLLGQGVQLTHEGDTVFWEKLELMEREEKLIYVAYPGGSHRTEFMGKRNEEGRYVFENPANDFPSVIEYIFENEKLRVLLKGKQGGKEFTEVLNMTKEK